MDFGQFNALQNLQNNLQNLQNNAANTARLQQLHANDAELSRLRQLLDEEAKKPKCPHCGGPCEQGFERCRNCGQEVIWHGRFVGKPGSLERLKAMHEQHEQAQRQAHMARMEAQKRAAQSVRRKQRSERLAGLIFWVLCFPLILLFLYVLLYFGTDRQLPWPDESFFNELQQALQSFKIKRS